MVRFIKTLKAGLPTFPRLRYGIFTGTNTFKEWRFILNAWCSPAANDQVQVIEDYERSFAVRVNTQHAVSFGAGRMALYAILEALDIGAGDEVIIPAFTCVVVPNAIIYRGARPIYVDIEPRTFNSDISKVESAISPRTKALYAQHTFGVPCNLDGLRALGRRYELPVIEDGAHALGGNMGGYPMGSLTEVAFFTTDHSKVMNTHLGGMVTVNDADLAKRLQAIQQRTPFLSLEQKRRLLRTFLLEYLYFAPMFHWLGRTIHILLNKIGFMFYFLDELKTTLPTEYPYPCRLSSEQARLGLSQLSVLQKNLAHRQKIATWLEQNIGWYGLSEQEIQNYAWLRYSFLVKNREAFIERFRHRFDLDVWFTSIVGGREIDLAAVGYQEGSCPTAEWVTKHIVNFPTHPRVPLEMIQKEVGRNLNWLKEQLLVQEKGS